MDDLPVHALGPADRFVMGRQRGLVGVASQALPGGGQSLEEQPGPAGADADHRPARRRGKSDA
jgi:hypothetical protein